MTGGAEHSLGASRASDAPLSYLSVKRFEDPISARHVWLYVCIGLSSLFLGLGYQLTLLFIWLVVLVAGQVMHSFLVRRLPETGPRSQIRLVVVSKALNGFIYVVPGVYLWVQGIPILTFFSLAFLAAGMLNVLARRAYVRVLLNVELILISLGVLGRVAWLWWVMPGTLETWAMSLLLLAVHGFFLWTAFEVQTMREQLQLRIAERLEAERQRALGQFTGGVAHDFNNLLTAVLGNIELARLSDNPAERADLMSQAEKAARRGADLTGRLLVLSSKARLSPVAVTPERLVLPVRDMAAAMLGPAHPLRVLVSQGLPAIFVDQTKFQAVLLELICNARDAMPEGGAIVLSAEHCPDGDTSKVRFAVTDSGRGIPETMMQTVFEPYFTTKSKGRNSGLGLAMVRGFVEQSRGALSLLSGNGRGTHVQIDLPVASVSLRESGRQQTGAEPAQVARAEVPLAE